MANQIAYVLPLALVGNSDPTTGAPAPGLLLQLGAWVLAPDNSQVRTEVGVTVKVSYGDDAETVSRAVAAAFHAVTADDPRVDPNAEVVVFLEGHTF